MDKAEADRHDKMLELAELLAEVLQKAVPSLIFRSLLFAIGKKNLYRCALFGCIWTDACESKWGREL